MAEEIKPKSKMWIVGANLGVMLLYAMICYAQGSSGLVAMWVIMIAHVAISFIVGIGAAIMSKSSIVLPWILSSILILLIGLSTCFMAVSGLGHM